MTDLIERLRVREAHEKTIPSCGHNAADRERAELIVLLREAAAALEAAGEDAWLPIETAPKDGNCLLAIETDDGYTFAVLERDKKGNWIHEGEPTYRHGYYFNPTHWRPLPAPPAIDAARKELGND